MRQILSTAVVALIVGSVAGASMGALAQSEPQGDVTPGGLNADRVDGKHAVGFTNRRGRRAGKLVATNRSGWLPSNIIQPLWGLIKNKPPVLADGQVSWNEVPGKPAVLADGQVSWNEVSGKPPGFEDDVDNAGVTKITVTRVLSTPASVPNGVWTERSATCPAGAVVTGGGFLGYEGALITDSFPSEEDQWTVWMDNDSGSARVLTVYAICMSVDPGGRLVTAAKGRGLEPARARS